MSKKYELVRLMDMLEISGEDGMKNFLSGFSCPMNDEITMFLEKNAVEFSKKKMSMTHFVVDSENRFQGYFALTHKVIRVPAGIFSKNQLRRLSRHARPEIPEPEISMQDISGMELNEEDKAPVFTMSAFLIGQFSANFSIPKEDRISGDDLMQVVLDKLKDVQQEIGGEVVFLECEDRPEVLEFYKRQKFIEFGIRVSDSEIDRGSAYPQLMRFV